ncbi:MAG TPA: HYR domain-containing protein [Blastocatellia bacterium]|nr:HYR domain-containing protein [Blastocatellia bacterium]
MRKRLLVWIGSGLAPIAFVFLADSGVLSPAAKAFDPAAPPMTFTVTTNGDTGAGSLRAAIDQANTTPGADVINFNGGLGTINVGSTTGMPLPTITEAVTIDGGAPKVELDGTAAGAAADGLTIMAAGVSIQNLVINRFSGAGINIQGDANNIQGNLIGTNAAGTSALPNASGGVVVLGANNVIGGTTAATRNVISGNDLFGVGLANIQAHNNTVLGNFIGTDAGGNNPLGNGGTGVAFFGGAFNNTVGGSAAGAGNTIAFNAGAGVAIPGGFGNAILTNSIFNNAQTGINLSDDAGVTPNDPCDIDPGANALQNFPVLTSALTFGGATSIQGTLDSAPASTFRIEFFSNANCDASGNGQGRTFLGATNVATNASCIANINFNIGVAVPAGQVVTATATDPSGNTSEFSACVTVTLSVSCTITCPASFTSATGPDSTSCGVKVDYPAPSTIGPCGTVNCTPPPGSIFEPGSTVVTCAEVGGASCSFTVTIVDNTTPQLSCTTGVSTKAPPGASSAVVNYPAPTATDNCAEVDVMCSPPSGGAFPIGATLVTCTAADLASNITHCFFNVTVFDATAPVIVCPANVRVSPQPGATSAVVTYPLPRVTDDQPGVSVQCVPSSGSTFPLCSTTVICTATDASGNTSNCSFAVLVAPPGPQLRVTIPGAQLRLEFPVRQATRKPNPNPDFIDFNVQNIGCTQVSLLLDAVLRVGPDVSAGRITKTDDRKLFDIRWVLSNGVERPVACDVECPVIIAANDTAVFRVRFTPVLPGLAGKTTGLAAENVLPDLVTSKFQLNTDLDVDIVGHVATPVQLINGAKPRKAGKVSLTRIGGDVFLVSYSVYDSNLDVKSAKYEFLTGNGQVVGEAVEADLSQALSSANLVRGQSFSVEQRFTGAGDHPDVASVRVTLLDGESHASIATATAAITKSSLQLLNRTRGVTLYLPSTKLGPPVQ